MEGKDSAASPRKPRVDAERNRQRLLEVAKAGFAEKGPDVSLEEIARAAGVGIGTLYRHFPTRQTLVEQVYRNESEKLAQAAIDLGHARPPVEALREWMLLFVDYFATKRMMAEALNALACGTSNLYAASGTQIGTSISALVDRAIASGDIRMTVDGMDLLRAVAGVASISSGPNWQESARRLVDILIAGIRVPDR